MRVLPTSYSDELDVEVESPEAIMELKEGDFSRLYPVLQEYRKLNEKKRDGLLKRIGSAISGKKKKPAEKNPDFKKINLVFPDNVLDDWETHSRLDGIRAKFREYCAIERKKEEAAADRLSLVKSLLIFGGTVVVTNGLGVLALLEYLPVLNYTPLLISGSADVVLGAGIGARYFEMKHRDKIRDIEMVDDAKLHFLDKNEYSQILEERKNSKEHQCSEKNVYEEKIGGTTTIIELGCHDFMSDVELMVDVAVEKCGSQFRKKDKNSGIYDSLKGYVRKKFSRKKEPPISKPPVKIVVSAEGNCDNYVGLQEKFRETCRTERMDAEKKASKYERGTLIMAMASVVVTYGLDAAAYLGMLPTTVDAKSVRDAAGSMMKGLIPSNYVPLAIDGASDAVLFTGLIPKYAEMGQREKIRIFEELENAEVSVVPRSSGYCSSERCSDKSIYCSPNAQG